MCVDLHTHSVYSDGTQTPTELLETARKAGLHAVSLTDHDTVDGIEEFLDYGRRLDMQVISGLEVSSSFRDISLHILGYGIDHRLRTLKAKLAELQSGRRERNRKIIGKLQNMGLDISIQELNSYSRCGQAGRPHIAGLLQQKGVVRSMDCAFRHYLRKGAPAYADRFAFSAGETIDMIHMAGGVAILAHPGYMGLELKQQPKIIQELAALGLDGLETYYPGHTPKQVRILLELAERHKLLVTGGSDYHGGHKPHRKLAQRSNGFCPPDTIFSQLRLRLEEGGRTARASAA